VTTRTTARAARLDQVCADAVGLARGAITEVDPADVGEHLEAIAEGDRVVTHFFESHLAGYRGWRWAVTVTRVPRSRHVTVCETVLLPGPDALMAPGWVPWNERLQPGDLGVGDLLPTAADDDRLVPGYLELDDEDADEIADWSWQLGLGRPRVLSPIGRDDATDRWYAGDGGPYAPIAKAAPATCSTCGFWITLAGSLGAMFGACSNEFAPDDRAVVSADHGCGAHSEALVIAPAEVVPTAVTLIDDDEIEPLAVVHEPGSVEADAAEPLGHS
jgi:hypothetical protein